MKPDFLGAQASNTGDDFHEWWALRNALSLLIPDDDLLAVTVEGISHKSRKDEILTDWYAVDCGLYYGGYNIDNAKNIVIQQLKYSTSTPQKPWTVSEFTKSTTKNSNNSLISGLADSFTKVLQFRPDLISASLLKISLVSNRPIGVDLRKSLENKESPKYEILRESSGLNKNKFKTFLETFEFSNCGSGSRFEQEEKAIEEIFTLTGSLDRGFVLSLKDHIHKLMLPESTGKVVNVKTILSWMNVSAESALFPCPSKLKTVAHAIDRNIAKKVCKSLLNGDQFVCLHGEGGTGKTTVLRQVERLLPKSSVMITYDCYGAGTYMESDAYRHRPKDAYLQIINELASKIRLPLLINQDSAQDYLEAFNLRLESACSVLNAQIESALLVIVIDAADNSITGAKQCMPEEVSFVHELLKVGKLPSNARLIVSSRSGRLPSLGIPARFKYLNISNFSIEETKQNSHNMIPGVTEDWIEDFHNLSNNNPRVQGYAFEYADSDPAKAIHYLKPYGKNLDQVFEARFSEAIIKEGDKNTLHYVCSALIALPSPVPKDKLAHILGESRGRVEDIISDLPGLRTIGDEIGLADEDVEAFVREKAAENLSEAYKQTADYLYAIYETDEYASIHIASALFASDQGHRIIDVIENKNSSIAVKDQIRRREVNRQRLQLAMQICRNYGSTGDAITVLLSGAEAMKTEDAVNKIIVENPQLSSNFAQDSVGRTILYSSKTYPSHGRFLSHIIALNAYEKDYIGLREKRRILYEWFDRRRDDVENQEREGNSRIDYWPIEAEDIAAVAYAILEMKGIQDAYAYIRSWRPRNIQFEVALLLISRLLDLGEQELVQKFLNSSSVPKYWSALFSIPLALTGCRVDIDKLENALCHNRIFKCVDLQKSGYMSEDDLIFRHLEMLLTGFEILVANGKSTTLMEPFLEKLCPREWRLIDDIHIHNISRNDISFRAFTLLMRSRKVKIDIESFWILPSVKKNTTEIEKKDEAKTIGAKKAEVREKASSLFSIYEVRANILLSHIPLCDAGNALKLAIDSFHSNSWRISREYSFRSMSNRLATTIGTHLILPGFEVGVMFSLVKSCSKNWPAIQSIDQAKVIELLIKIPELRLQLVKDIHCVSSGVDSLKSAANEKIETLLSLSKLLLFIDKEESRALFRMAIDIASDVDVEAMHEVSLFCSLAKSAKDHLSLEESKLLASSISSLTIEYATLLEGYEHFPWRDAIGAVATLNVSACISLIGYCEDYGLSSFDATIPPLLSVGLETKSVSAAQALSLLNFVDQLDDELVEVLISSVEAQDGDQFIEEVSKHVALGLHDSNQSIVCGFLNKLKPFSKKSGFWQCKLNELVNFRTKNDSAGILRSSVEVHGISKSEKSEKSESVFFSSISLPDIPINCAHDFLSFIELSQGRAKANGTYVAKADIIQHIATITPQGGRIDFLNVLIDKITIDGVGYPWVKALTAITDKWSQESHAVSNWRIEHIPGLIVDYLDDFTYDFAYGGHGSTLPQVLDSFGFTNEDISSLLLEALETNSNSLSLSKLYAMIGLLAEYSSSRSIFDVTSKYLNRLTNQLRLEKNIQNINCNVAETVDSAIVHQIYSCLGDVDVRIRWRAGHSIRTFARMGDFQVIVALTELYNHKAMPGYRQSNVPFYWLSARLWLVIALDRISTEVPDAVSPIYRWLLEISTDTEFPHVLIRHFAKSCLSKLVSGGHIELSIKEKNLLQNINESALIEEKGNGLKKKSRYNQLSDDGESRRFHFDNMDTLSHVYPTAINCFSNVTNNEFLEVAESWIIDRWGYDAEVWKWDEEPRKSQFQQYSYELYSHSHGGMPTLERISYYLEMHAMWCSVGTLIDTKALAESEYEDDDYGTLRGFLKADSLTQPPHWSSDLLSLKPLERRFYYPPISDSVFDRDSPISSKEFDVELGLVSGSDYLVVDSNYDVNSRKLGTSSRISSALVAPDTALALLRALQLSNDSHDYRMPPRGDSGFEIDEGAYCLQGWLEEFNSDSRIDKKDVFNQGVEKVETFPSQAVIEALGLRQSPNYPATWVDASSNESVFVYEAWSDGREDAHRRDYIYGDEIKSDGHSLKIAQKSLYKYLNHVNFDLILEVEIVQRANENGITQYDQKSEDYARFSRIYLFRRAGEIFTIEGCVGTWASFGE